jgi:hypothetical protein
MGVLTAGAATGNDTPADVSDDHEEPAAAEPAPAEEKREFVPFSAVEAQGRKPGSRRDKAEKEVSALIDERIKPFRETWDKDRQSYEQRIQQAQQDAAQLRGQLEAMQKMPAYQPQPAQRGPDPEALTREALDALDKQDLSTYHRKWGEAQRLIAETAAESRVKAAREEWERSQPRQLPPYIQTLLVRHPSVSAAGDRGAMAVQLKENELALYGVQQGPDRTAKAFELAEKFLESLKGGQPQRQSYSPDAAQALTSVPTARPAAASGSGGEPGVHLNELQRNTARAAGMSNAEYVRWMDPEKFRR